MDSQKPKRPLGIAVLAVLCLAGAVHSLSYVYEWAARQWSYYQRGFWPQSESLWEAIIIHPLTHLVFILAWIAFCLRLGWGLWKLENSARIGFAVLAWLNALLGVGIVLTVYLQEPEKVGLADWAPMVGVTAFAGGVTAYLLLPRIRQAFKKES